MKVLLVEDDLMIGENVQIALEAECISTDWAVNGSEAEQALSNQDYDAVLLDLGLPKKSGLELLQSIRSRGNAIPVLIITARDTISERVQGLNAGGDDYLVKPFDLGEMIARLHALVRRARRQTEPAYSWGEIVINTTSRQVEVAGQAINLSAREWSILDALIARPGAILSRNQLEERLYGWTGDVESNAVEVYIHGLRKKLGPQFILNVRGVGYRVAT